MDIQRDIYWSADQSNSFSLILTRNVLNASAFLCIFSSILFMCFCRTVGWNWVVAQHGAKRRRNVFWISDPNIQQTFRLSPLCSMTHFHPTFRQRAASLGATANQTIIPIMRTAEQVHVTSKCLWFSFLIRARRVRFHISSEPHQGSFWSQPSPPLRLGLGQAVWSVPEFDGFLFATDQKVLGLNLF